jgi:hypothetical protein
MCAYSQYNIIIEDRYNQPLNEIDDQEGYDDMPELIDDLPDLEPASPVLLCPEEEEDMENQQPEDEEIRYEYQQLMERLNLNLRELYDSSSTYE